jgi:hypothetical protein
MACVSLTKGRGLDCNRSSGGVRYLYFSVFDDFDNDDWALDAAAGIAEIDTINFNGNDIYRYTVPRGSTTVDEAITGDTNAGTIFYTPTVSMVLNKITEQMQEQMKLLGSTQVRIFAQLNEEIVPGAHDVIIALGMVNGMSMNAGTVDSGASFGDRNGYTLNWDGLESVPFPMLEDYTTVPFDNAGFTITPATDIITS